jgi:hypothetical protein
MLEVLEEIEKQGSNGWKCQYAIDMLAQHEISESDAHHFIKEIPSNDASSSAKLYMVVGYKPVVNLLSKASAPFCRNYVEKSLTKESAGKYFMAFAVPEWVREREMFVARLPPQCKDRIAHLNAETAKVSTENGMGLAAGVFVGAVANVLAPGSGPILGPLAGTAARSATHLRMDNAEKSAVDEATRAADDILAGKDKEQTLATLKSMPTATPKPLLNIIQLVKRLQRLLKKDEEQRVEADAEDQTNQICAPIIVDWEDLLDIEPYLYGNTTPMCEALQSMQPLFKDPTYTYKTTVLISDGIATDGNPVPDSEALHKAGGTIFACLLTDPPIKHQRQLYASTEIDTEWSNTVKAMFAIASTVSCDSGAVQELWRRGWKLPASGQCKLFVQANNPMVVDEFTTASRELGTSWDALAQMIGEVSLDQYIRKWNEGATVTEQDGQTCWAHATARVFHLASKRVQGRKVDSFKKIREHLFREFGGKSQNVEKVLERTCAGYRLRYRECDEVGARDAIHARRPVIATFQLDGRHWFKFHTFYDSTPGGTLTMQQMSAPGEQKHSRGGHAVVLVRCDESSLTFMNSWGQDWNNGGFFTIDHASTLGICGEPVRFYDIYWTIDDLTNEEEASWKELEKNAGNKIIGALPQSFHNLPVRCERCKQSAPAKDYDGKWYEARCRKCGEAFTPTVWALIRSLYEKNYH